MLRPPRSRASLAAVEIPLGISQQKNDAILGDSPRIDGLRHELALRIDLKRGCHIHRPDEDSPDRESLGRRLLRRAFDLRPHIWTAAKERDVWHPFRPLRGDESDGLRLDVAEVANAEGRFGGK